MRNPPGLHAGTSCTEENVRARSRIFRRGGVDPFWGGFGLQCGHFSVKMYAKTKELGPVGACAGTPPRYAYECVRQFDTSS